MIEKLTHEDRKTIQEHQENLPVNMGKLSKAFGVTAYIAHLNDGVSGQIIKDDNEADKYAIFVSDSDSKNRQRFTAAHELSHFLLHKDKIGDGIVDSPLYRGKLSNRIEVEANKLAADILMPYDKINTEIDKGIKTISKLAEYFGVSTQAMKVRLGIPT
jgi:Zn-dependent peptidase ImmA (M78 family)